MVIDGWICRAAAIFEAMASEPMCGESTLQLIVRVRERSVLARLVDGSTEGFGPASPSRGFRPSSSFLRGRGRLVI